MKDENHKKKLLANENLNSIKNFINLLTIKLTKITSNSTINFTQKRKANFYKLYLIKNFYKNVKVTTVNGFTNTQNSTNSVL